LPSILPELDAEAKWDRIMADSRTRPSLSKLGDKIAAELKTNPERFPEIKSEDFD